MVDEDIRIENGHKLIIETPSGGDSNVKISAITIGPDPILFIDRGIKGYKDLNLYGFVGVSTDEQKVAGGAAIMMGHGFTGSTDPPRISLTDSELVNQILYSENFLNSVWTSYDGSKTNVTSGYLCPDNTNNTAYKFEQCGQNGGCRGCWQSSSPSLQQNQKYAVSIWLKGTYDSQPVMIGLNDTYNTTVYLTTTWKRYFYTVTIPQGGGTSRGLQFNSGITGDTYYAWGAQLESVAPTDPDGYHRSYVKTESTSNSRFDTIYLYRADGSTPANLDVGDLTVHGDLIVYGSFWNASLINALFNFPDYITGFGENFLSNLLSSIGNTLHFSDDKVDINPSSTPTVAGLYLTNGGFISMNNGTLVLDNGSTGNGILQYGTGNYQGMRLAQTTNGYDQSHPSVLSLQTYTDAGHTGTFTWQLGVMNMSTLFADHINSASAAGIYLFDDLRLYGPTSGHKLYDSANNAGSDGQFLMVDPTTHLPKWTSYTPTWNGGTVTNSIQTNGVFSLSGIHQLWAYDTTDVSFMCNVTPSGGYTQANSSIASMGLNLRIDTGLTFYYMSAGNSPNWDWKFRVDANGTIFNQGFIRNYYGELWLSYGTYNGYISQVRGANEWSIGSVAGLEGLSAFKAAVIAACAQFFVFLALKRGIVQRQQVQ
jgi:hypothetical protein